MPALRLQRILDEAGVTRIDALKIDIEGFEDRALIAFFKEAPQTLWPRAVVIEHLSRDEWQQDCIADMIARGYREAGTDPQQHAAGARLGPGEFPQEHRICRAVIAPNHRSDS